jgi:hypothetical protein
MSSEAMPPQPAAAMTQAVAAAVLTECFSAVERRCRQTVAMFPEFILLAKLGKPMLSLHPQPNSHNHIYLLSASLKHPTIQPGSTSIPALISESAFDMTEQRSLKFAMTDSSRTNASAFSFVLMPRIDIILECFSKRRARRSTADGLTVFESQKLLANNYSLCCSHAPARANDAHIWRENFSQRLQYIVATL